jgi:rhodanese-related sulfurtransferase
MGSTAPEIDIDEHDRSRPVHVVCASGYRSAAIPDLLAAGGSEARTHVHRRNRGATP